MDTKSNPLKRRDMGIAGSIIVLSQVLSTFQSSTSISEQIKDLKISIQEVRIDQETNFVRKEQGKDFDRKIEEIKENVKQIRKEVEKLRSDYALSPEENEIAGCVNTEEFHAFARGNNHITTLAY